MNNVDMPSVASFTLGIFIQAINSMSDKHKVTANSVMSEKLRGFIFKIKSEPAKNFNIKVANSLVYLKDLKSKFDVDKFYNLLKSVGNLNKEITEKNVFGTARDSVVNHIQQNFLGDDTIFENFMKKQQKFTEDEALEYFAMILLGLDFLHSKNIFHRDLKPANILISEHINGEKLLCIGDFGISKYDLDTIK
jgi:serine/threonine protein kinase